MGVVPNPHLADAALTSAGDSLVFYTDGVTEARNDTGMLGEHRLQTLLARAPAWTPTRSRQRSRTAAVDMQQGETRDDIAVVVLAGRRKCWRKQRKNG